MVFEEESDVSDISPNNNLALLGLILVAIAPSVSVITGFAFKAGLRGVFLYLFLQKYGYLDCLHYGIYVSRKVKNRYLCQRMEDGLFQYFWAWEC